MKHVDAFLTANLSFMLFPRFSEPKRTDRRNGTKVLNNVIDLRCLRAGG